MPLPPFALAHRALVPLEREPLEVAQQLVLPARDVPGRIRVVDPQQRPVAERARGHRAERVADVERARRAGSEPGAPHGAESSVRPGTWSPPRKNDRELNGTETSGAIVTRRSVVVLFCQYCVAMFTLSPAVGSSTAVTSP